MRDTIFALATAPGRSAVAIMRVSGPDAEPILSRLCGKPPLPRMATVRAVHDLDGGLIDRALVFWFPSPRSFTGEDVFELQLHGGRAVIEAVAEALSALGARPADAGEFTRRAFEAGRLDLAQAEAIADLVDAETEAQRHQALAQLDGALTKQGEAWRETLLTALAFLEAQIDFPDEDVPPDVAAEARAPLSALAAMIDENLIKPRGEQIRDGVRIALIGAPNAGKSSLLNALTKRDAAIVTAQAGTTRDIIEVPMTIEGYKVLLADTAGLRATEDEIEIEGIRRAEAWARSADLRLWIVDPQDEDEAAGDLILPGDILVLTKADIEHRGDFTNGLPSAARSLKVVITSTVSRGGLDCLKSVLNQWINERLVGSDFPIITQMRHRLLLEEAALHLRRALSRPLNGAELMAEDVRLAARALERLTGRLNPEDVLGRVFSTFCIGK